MGEALRQRSAVRRAILALTGILGFLLVGQVISPGFTHYWGYHVPQVTFYLSVALIGETLCRRAGGLFGAPTLAVVVAVAAADVFGTSADLYSGNDYYDKIVHLLGTAALTAVVLDILLARAALRGSTGSPGHLVVLGVILGIAAGLAWELYEHLGDALFHSDRTLGRVDTAYDILFDVFGALLMGSIVSLRVWPIAWRTPLPERRLIDPLLDSGSHDAHAD